MKNSASVCVQPPLAEQAIFRQNLKLQFSLAIRRLSDNFESVQVWRGTSITKADSSKAKQVLLSNSVFVANYISHDLAKDILEDGANVYPAGYVLYFRSAFDLEFTL